MSSIDRHLKVKGKDYYATFSTTSDQFYSPIFRSIKDYVDWYSNFDLKEENVVFDYGVDEYPEEIFINAKKALALILKGENLDSLMRESLRSAYVLNTMMKDISFDFEEIERDFEKLNLPASDYASFFDLIYDLFDNNKDFEPTVLKLIGKYLSKCFAEVDNWEFDDFADLYNKTVNFSKDKPKPTPVVHYVPEVNLWEEYLKEVIESSDISIILKTINSGYLGLNFEQAKKVNNSLLNRLKDGYVIKITYVDEKHEYANRTSKEDKVLKFYKIGSNNWNISYDESNKSNRWIIDRCIQIPDPDKIEEIIVYDDFDLLKKDLLELGISETDLTWDMFIKHIKIKAVEDVGESETVGHVLLAKMPEFPKELVDYLLAKSEVSLRELLSENQIDVFKSLYNF